ncbi:MAG: RluA family pseudouridine synthase [Candidatus Promineifilaceae bacterium]
MGDTLSLDLNDYIGMRLDRALTAAHPDFSRSRWQKLLKEQKVLINGQPVKANLKVEAGTSAEVTLPEVKTTELIAENIPLDIRYEDEDLIVVNKAAGMVVHPAAGHESGTLVNALMYHCPDLPGIGGEIRPGIVHRLDKDTSGLMVVAKHDQSLRHLQAQFKERTVHKLYIALVNGRIQPEIAMVDAPIGRDPKQRKKMAVIPYHSSATAREAQTSYEADTIFDDYSLINCTLHTGRTHQIRVHMAYVGYPLVGDSVYGRRKSDILKRRHFLHAAELGFEKLTGERVGFSAELPPKLQKIIDNLHAAP